MLEELAALTALPAKVAALERGLAELERRAPSPLVDMVAALAVPVSLTATLIAEIEARTWGKLVAKEVEGTLLGAFAQLLVHGKATLEGETLLEGVTVLKRLQLKEAIGADEVNLVAGAQELAEPVKSFLIWKVTGAIAAEVTGLKAEGIAAGTFALLNMRMTAGTKITLVSRAAGVLEQNRFNMPENVNKVYEGGAAVTAHTALLVKTNQGWQLVPGG